MSWVNKEKTELALSPTKWHASKLSELAKIKSGDGITSEDIHDSGDYPCYGGNGLRGWVSNWNREGDHCLVGRQGALCGNVKRVAGKYYASEHAIVFEPKPKVDPDWLYHRLVSLNLNRFSESSAQPGLAVSKIASLRIAAPPLREQTKIGEILSTWDKSIEATERLLENSKKRKKALMQKLLTGKKRLPGFGERWQKVSLCSVADVIVSPVDKKTVEGQERVRLCNYMDVYSNPYIKSDMTFMVATASEQEIARFSIKKGDVLITKDSETPNDIAVPALIEDNLEGVVCGYHLAIIRPKIGALDGAYLAFLLRTPETRHYFYTLANGATRFGLPVGAIQNAEFEIPSFSAFKVLIRPTKASIS